MSGPEHSDLPPRLVPDEPLPRYSYVTGRFPHPTRDAAGHGFGHTPGAVPRIAPDRWHDSRVYLWACDLFNHGYYWEAHEVWESLWQAEGRTGIAADFLKGLIKLAAAGVKAREGRPAGVERHARRARELFQSVRTRVKSGNYLGLDVDRLLEIAADLPAHVHLSDARDAAVEIVFDFRIVPVLPSTK